MKDLYAIVGDKIIEFCDKTYYSDIVISFEQSYDGKEWTKEVEFASFENCTDLYYENDWNEGQTHIRNLRIWHLEDSEPVIRCKDCKHWDNHDGGERCLNPVAYLSWAKPDSYCYYAEGKEDL